MFNHVIILAEGPYYYAMFKFRMWQVVNKHTLRGYVYAPCTTFSYHTDHA